jgi:hypothetical protein
MDVLRGLAKEAMAQIEARRGGVERSQELKSTIFTRTEVAASPYRKTKLTSVINNMRCSSDQVATICGSD